MVWDEVAGVKKNAVFVNGSTAAGVTSTLLETTPLPLGKNTEVSQARQLVAEIHQQSKTRTASSNRTIFMGTPPLKMVTKTSLKSSQVHVPR
jgi:hypothetical protein